MDHHFDPAQSAKSFDDPARDAWQMPDRVIAELALKPGSSVADIGSGTGYFSVRLAKSPAHPTVYGSDLEPGMVKYLADRATQEGLTNIVSVQATTTSPRLPAPVDVVLIVDTWHHIGGRVAYFRELRKSLKPGGRVAIVDFKPDSPEGPPKEFRFPPEQVRKEMAEAGYRMTASPGFLPRQMFLLFETTASPR
jgi:cyclopropane fatty-acyl-phospholipid synthase-like methyltransferase